MHQRDDVLFPCVPLYTHHLYICKGKYNVVLYFQPKCVEDIVYFIFYTLLVLQLCLHCIAERYAAAGYHELDYEVIVIFLNYRKMVSVHMYM